MAGSDFWNRLRRAHLVKVLFAYIAGCWIILQVVETLKESLDLPAWVQPVAFILLLIGLLIIAATAWVQSHPHVERREAAEEVPGSWELDVGEFKDALASGRLPHLTWTRALLGGAFAFALLFGFAGLFVLLQERDGGSTPPPTVTLDPDAPPGIAVLPFTTRGEGMEVWREGLVDVLSTNLDDAGGLRGIDSRTILARWQETVPADIQPDLATSLAVATRAGARHAVLGNVVSTGADMRLTADVYELESAQIVGQAQVEGPVDSVFALVDQLSIEIVRAIAGGAANPTLDLAGLTTSSVPALKSYLEGESLMRQGEFASALEAYDQAIEADSSFALAFYRKSEAIGWTQGVGSPIGVAAAARAEQLSDRLTARDAVIVQAVNGMFTRRVDRVEPLRQLVRHYPDDAEAWFVLGDLYMHLGAAMATREDMETAFSRAVELQPRFAPYQVHLVEMATPDSALFKQRLEYYAELIPGSPLSRAHNAVFGILYGDSTQRGNLAILDSLDDETLAFATGLFGHPEMTGYHEVAHLGVTERGGRDRSAHIASASFWWGGQIETAISYLDRVPADSPVAICLPYWIDRLTGAIDEQRLTDALDPGRAAQTTGSVALCIGAFAADRGRWEDFEQVRSGLERKSTEIDVDSATRAARTATLRTLDGYGAWKRGDAETGWRQLREAIAMGTHETYSVFELRWWLGELAMEARGPEEALRYLIPDNGYDTYPLIFLYRGRVYEELGDIEGALESYERFLRLWADADPVFEPRLEDARQSIDRLTAESEDSDDDRP